MEDNLFDKIYALRISLMDTYYDETKIIYFIKQNLYKYDNITTDDQLNMVIINFYKQYDIDITTIDFTKLNVVSSNNSLINNELNSEIEYLNNFINIYNSFINHTNIIIDDEINNPSSNPENLEGDDELTPAKCFSTKF